MGQCVSSESHQKDPDTGHKYLSSESHQKDPDSGHKYLQPSSLRLQHFLSSPPLKEKSQTVQFTKFDQNSKASSFSYGSEKEAFYDTQPWLDSDCEDDFYSVNGDCTPSRGSTPVHCSFASPEIRRSPYFHNSGSALASLTPGSGQCLRKKSLSDLFEESGRYVNEKGILGFEAAINFDEEFVYTSATNTPCTVGARSSYSGQKTPEGNVIVRKVSSLKSVKCCLPQLLVSQSFTTSRKKEIKSSSPA